MNVTVDKDILFSLKCMYFGSLEDLYKAAAYRAYRDFNRTIHFNIKTKYLAKAAADAEKAKRTETKDHVVDIMREEVANLHHMENLTQEKFDQWHQSLCEHIIATYHELSSDFSYGQAQKWVNMTIKYLYLLEADNFAREFKYLHIPIDKYIREIAHDKFGLPKPRQNDPWSKWNYNEYITYQKALCSHITGEDPLRWEFHNWLSAARDFDGEEE